jgi:septal ring factor EnvC (AmiA/AmiB activator)
MTQISEMVSEREKRVQQLEGELKKSNDSNKEMKKQIDGLSAQVMKDCEMITTA